MPYIAGKQPQTITLSGSLTVFTVYPMSYLLAPFGLLTLALEVLMHLKVDSFEYMTFDESSLAVKCR
jgi:hypothetical protein